MTRYSLVIDIGKTHVKLHVLDDKYNSVFSKQMKNTVVKEGHFPSINTSEIWGWLIAGIKEITPKYRINAINITTHGATAALIDRNSIGTDGLVLPILDYEYADVFEQSPEYESIRPSFNDTFSPSLPPLSFLRIWFKRPLSVSIGTSTVSTRPRNSPPGSTRLRPILRRTNCGTGVVVH